MTAANWGMLGVGVIFGGAALVFQSKELLALGLLLVIVQLFWCFGLYIVLEQYRVFPEQGDRGLLASWTRVMSWYGAVFCTLWFAMLIFATFVVPVLMVVSFAS